MICPQCGALVDDELKNCDNCGYEFSTPDVAAETDESDYNITKNVPALKQPMPEPPKRANTAPVNFYRLFICICAAAIAVLSFYGAHYIARAAVSLNSIQISAAQSIFGFGTSDNTTYYQNLGVIFYGFAYFVRAVGVGLAGIILAIGLKKQK